VPDYPPSVLAAAESAIIEAATDFGHDDLVAGSSRKFARAALDATAPLLAEAVAQRILEHAERQHPRDPDHVPTAWHRHFSIAARVAAGAFDTREDQLRMAAEAIERGDYVACNPSGGAR
jgi:hypothetical protein